MTKQYSKKVAFFDLDGTLVKKDTYSLFIKCLQDNKLCDEQFIQKDKELLKQFVNGTLNMEEFFRFALLPLINLNKAQIKEIGSSRNCRESYGRLIPNQCEEIVFISVAICYTFGYLNLIIHPF